MKGEKGIGGAVTAADGLSEELTEEAFGEQCCDVFIQLHLMEFSVSGGALGKSALRALT